MGQVEVMKLLLDHGAKVNARDKKFSQTALMWAAGQPTAVRLLVDRGADIRATTATWDVKYTIYAPTTVTLGKTGIPWNTDGEYTSRKGGQNALFFAVQKHDVESARILADAGLDVNLPAADGTTLCSPRSIIGIRRKSCLFLARAPSLQAVTKFHADLNMARLLRPRREVTVADTAGYTPLLECCCGRDRAPASKGQADGRNASPLQWR
jgi:hypothetical protein